jgi:hypothetical protein
MLINFILQSPDEGSGWHNGGQDRNSICIRSCFQLTEDDVSW